METDGARFRGGSGERCLLGRELLLETFEARLRRTLINMLQSMGDENILTCMEEKDSRRCWDGQEWTGMGSATAASLPGNVLDSGESVRMKITSMVLGN